MYIALLCTVRTGFSEYAASSEGYPLPNSGPFFPFVSIIHN